MPVSRPAFFLTASLFWALVGRRVLVAHNSDPVGWHIGRIRFFGVSTAAKKLCPAANFILRYTKKETNAEIKEGHEEARELTARNYGRGRVVAPSRSGARVRHLIWGI